MHCADSCRGGPGGSNAGQHSHPVSDWLQCVKHWLSQSQTRSARELYLLHCIVAKMKCVVVILACLYRSWHVCTGLGMRHALCRQLQRRACRTLQANIAIRFLIDFSVSNIDCHSTLSVCQTLIVETPSQSRSAGELYWLQYIVAKKMHDELYYFYDYYCYYYINQALVPGIPDCTNAWLLY